MAADDTREDIPGLLSAAAIARYMRATGWDVEGKQGTYGSVFTKAGGVIGVPHEDDDPDAVRMALYRLAVAEGIPADEMAAAVLAGAQGARAGGCGWCRDPYCTGDHPGDAAPDPWPAVPAEACGSTIAAGAPEVTSPAPAPAERPGTATGPAGEALGRLVHQERLDAEAERAEAEGRRRFLLEPWGERTEWQRELDIRIGEAVAAAERERIAQLAEAWRVTAYEDWDGDGIAVGVPFADLIREGTDRG